MKEQSITDFAVLLNELDGGKLRDEASGGLSRLVQYLEQYALDTRRTAKGKLAIVLNVKVDDRGLAVLDGTVAVKQPEPLRGSDSFFVTKKGGLARDNPRQAKLPLREITDSRTGEVRDV